MYHNFYTKYDSNRTSEHPIYPWLLLFESVAKPNQNVLYCNGLKKYKPADAQDLALPAVLKVQSN